MRTKLMLTAALAATMCVAADDRMFPFVISYDAPMNVVNMSHLLDAPAGKNGRIRVKDGHFVNDKGRVRLHATNLTGPANFPTHAEAERLAARLARFGINCVRLHYFDSSYGTFMLPPEQGILTEDFRTRRQFDPERRDRQDYLLSQFKKRGIYVNMNLHVARTLDARDGFAPGSPWANKGVDQFDPRVIEMEKEYARELLSHVNPYTGLSYLKDPVVAVVELNNEDALWCEYLHGGTDHLGEPYATVFRNQWNDWLLKKYASSERLQAAWRQQMRPLGEEMITEGKFDGPVVPDGKTWILDKGSADATLGAAEGTLRMKVTKKGDEYFPKIYRRVVVKKDMPYTVSFRIRRTSKGTGEVGFAVADRSKGWESLGLLTKITPTDKWATHTFSFYAPEDVATAEIQFTRFNEGTFEIDDLSFKTGGASMDISSLSLEKGEIPIVKSRGLASQAMTRDFYQFLVDTEHAYWTGMRNYLQKDLGLEAPVSATQLGYSPPHLQAEMDYVDNHAYWCHPSVRKEWSIHNIAMVNSHGGCILSLAGQRVAGKPYTVSEYNHPYPLYYGAEGQPMLRAYGALQGWDGVFEYSYNNRQNAEPDHNEYFFSIVARTDVLAHFPACAAMYLRGDVKESTTKLVANLPYTEYFDRLVKRRSVGQGIAVATDGKLPTELGLIHQVAVDVTGKTPPVTKPVDTTASRRVATSDTGELVWNNEIPGAGVWTVNTPNTKLFTGFPKGREFDLGGVKLAVGETKLGWATVSLTSHDATGFGTDGRATRILLAATGLSHNGGAKFTDHGNNMISSRDNDWGHGPTVIEGIPATITLPAPAAQTTCCALNERGEPKADVPVKADASGHAVIAISPAFRTVWYEIAVKAK
ncbi:MAG: carbohydrate binding domain-containing protein [Kiritimatiellae bacterium]|nr:carbohydrate binding domain-containing protein [Kiritimatiellia bacterium]